jgi:hypothetical protein
MTLSVRPGRAPHRRRNGARITTAVFLACAAAAACSSNDAATAPPKASPASSGAQSSQAPDPTEAAKTAAINTYKQYWQEMERLYADEDADLKRHAASAALKNAEADAQQMHDKGLLIIGDVSVDAPTVTRADLDRKIPNVTLSSCLDVSRWKVIDSSTKKPAALPSDRLTKYVIVSTVEQWPQGWRVIKDEPQEKAC